MSLRTAIAELQDDLEYYWTCRAGESCEDRKRLEHMMSVLTKYSEQEIEYERARAFKEHQNLQYQDGRTGK